MSNKWPLVALGDILAKSEEFVEIQSDKTYRQVTVRLWGNGLALRGEVDGTQIATTKQNVIHPQQFVISRIDARNGASGIVPGFLDGAIVTNDFPVFNVEHSRLLPEFLGWMSRTQSFVELCKAASEGTTNRVRLKLGRFLATKTPLPPLDEQRRIVARIEALAAKVEQAQRLRQQSVTEINAFVSSLHLGLSKNNRVPVGEFLMLDELREPIQTDKEYPQIGIKGFGQGLFGKEAVKGTETTYKWFNRLYEGAIVLSQVKGWEGAIGVCPSHLADYYASPEYRTFRCIENKAIPEYLSSVLATPWFWEQLKHLHRGLGGRRQRTRPEQFLLMQIPMPTINQQVHALSIFEKLKPVKRHQAATAGRLESLLPSILDRAFRGEL